MIDMIRYCRVINIYIYMSIIIYFNHLTRIFNLLKVKNKFITAWIVNRQMQNRIYKGNTKYLGIHFFRYI